MGRRKLSVVEEGFILHNRHTMTIKEMSKHLDGIGPTTIENFLLDYDENEDIISTEEDIEKDREQKVVVEVVHREEKGSDKRQRKPRAVAFPKRQSLAGRDENMRTTVMTPAESQLSDDDKKHVPSVSYDPERVFRPNKRKPSF